MSAELQSREGRLQTERHQVNIKAKFIKLILHSGYAEFAAVNRISIIGSDGNDPRGMSNNNNEYRQPQSQMQPAYGMDEEEDDAPPPARKQAQRYDEPEEEEEEEYGNNQMKATYGGGRTEDEFAEHGAVHEDEF